MPTSRDLPPDDLKALDPAARDVLGALALGALARPRTWVGDALADPALRSTASVAPSQELVRHTLGRLQNAGFANDDERRPGFWTLPLSVYARVYAALVERVPHATLQRVLAHADGYSVLHLERQGHGRFPTLTAAVARVRLDAMNGASPGDIAQLLNRLPPGLHDIPALLDTAIAECVDETLFDRLHPALQSELLAQSLDRLGATLATGVALDAAFVRARAGALVRRDDAKHTHRLRWALAHDRLLADGAERRSPDWVDSFGTLLGPAIDAPPDSDLLTEMLASHGTGLAARNALQASMASSASPAPRRSRRKAAGRTRSRSSTSRWPRCARPRASGAGWCRCRSRCPTCWRCSRSRRPRISTRR